MNIVDRIISPNIWDEEWEVGGIDDATGINISSTRIRSKNYIRVISNTYYYFLDPTNDNNIRIFYYDANKNYIDHSSWIMGVQTVPQNCYYIRFQMGSSYGTTYKHDICINESNPSINGKYFPYIMYKRYDMVDLIHTHNLWNKTVKYNQRLNHYNFDSSSGWSSWNYGGSVSVSDGVATCTRTGYSTDLSRAITTIPNGHTILFIASIKTEENNVCNFGGTDVQFITTNSYKIYYKAKTLTSNLSRVYLNCIGANPTMYVNLFCLIDLTDWFKNDIPQALLNNPSTFNEYWDGELTYDTGTDVLPNNSIKRLKIGG